MGDRVRIAGVVGLARRVRHELAEGVSPARLESLREAVRQALEVTDRALKDAGAGPAALPAPTRAAYQFLAGVDFSSVQPAHDDAHDAPPPGTVHFPGLRAWLDDTLTRLSLAEDDGRRQSVYENIQTTGASMERGLRTSGILDGQLKPESRAIRDWLAHFVRAENFAAYLRGLATAQAAFAEAQARQGRFRAPVVIHFRPMKGVYRVRSAADGTLVHLPTPMITFDEPTFRLLAGLALLRVGGKRPVLDAMARPAYQAVLLQVEPRGDGSEEVPGLHHSLSDALERVRAAYFGDEMRRPALCWSRTFTGCKFGHYDAVRDTVMVSASLDRRDVPEHVIDFIVYHELVHRKLGVRWTGDRRDAHTPEFRAEEKRFARYAEVQAFLDRFVRDHLAPLVMPGRP
jgi:hypothetical protein